MEPQSPEISGKGTHSATRSLKFLLICKRRYTNRDLIADRFGRLYHLPAQLGRNGHTGLVYALDYRGNQAEEISSDGVTFRSLPIRLKNFIATLVWLYRDCSQFRPDVIIASGDTQLGILGRLLAARLKAPFVFDVYDDYRVFRSGRIPGFKALFAHVVRKSGLVVTASAPLAHLLARHNRSLLVLRNGVDDTLFKPLAREDARAALGIPGDETVVGFFGSIAGRRGVETLIAASDILRAGIPKLRLLVAGDNLLGIAMDAPGIDYRGMCPQKTIPGMIGACDVVVVPYERDPQVDVSNGCKIAEYLACGVPVVATAVSDHATIFADAPQSLCAPGDAQGMAAAISAQLQQPQRVRFDTGLTWANLGHKLSDALVRLCDEA